MKEKINKYNMTNIIIIHDNKDKEFGSFFLKCTENLICNYADKINIKVFNSDGCSYDAIEEFILAYPLSKFILVAYTHGTEDSLICNSHIYLSDIYDLGFLKDIFFYTISCSSGKKLGPKLIQSGVKFFWGYDKKVKVVLPYQNIFLQCLNYGLKKFLDGDTLNIAFNHANNYYNKKRVELEKKSYFAAAMLENNKACMIKIGDDLIAKEFYNQ